MPDRSDIGTRMKENYEFVSKTKLTRRTPVAIRLDGRAFHTFTRGFKRPFDEIFTSAMIQTMEYLCKNIQGAKFGYTQSDEITIILTDYDTLTTDAWFGYEVQKICSISASMATMFFNKTFFNLVADYTSDYYAVEYQFSGEGEGSMEDKYCHTLIAASGKGAMFDARCFNIPKEEVGNLIFWRQLDAERNSILSCGQHFHSHKELENKSCREIQNMMSEHGFDWEELQTYLKRGTACYRNEDGKWFTDMDMPRLNENWEYIMKHI